jgi:hypothetical protein
MNRLFLGLKATFVTFRISQWVKNLAIFAPIVFSGKLLNVDLFFRTSLGFIILCLLSSSNYVFNDILDSPSDQKHPYKKRRPIAKGEISISMAYFLSTVLAIAGLGLSLLLGSWFFVITLCFLIGHYANTIFLRNVRVIDIVMIAFFYVLRVYAGQTAGNVSISIWLTLSMLSLSLLLAAGKRRAEYAILHHRQILGNIETSQHGPQRYSEKLLDAYVAMFASATFITYAYYTFLSTPMTVGFFIPTNEPITYLFSARKWLMASVPFVLYGIMRYLQIIYSEPKDLLAQVLVTDRRLIFSLLLWFVSVLLVIYGLGG